MNPLYWLLFITVVLSSLGLALYSGRLIRTWGLSGQSKAGVTGCETARFILDQSGMTHVSVDASKRSEKEPALESLELPSSIYEGQHFFFIFHAAKKALFTTPLAHTFLWSYFKKDFLFGMRLLVVMGWIGLGVGLFVEGLEFLAIFSVGIFGVLFLLGWADFFLERKLHKRCLFFLQKSQYFNPNELFSLKKVGDGLSFSGLAMIVEAPIHLFKYFLLRKGTSCGL